MWGEVKMWGKWETMKPIYRVCDVSKMAVVFKAIFTGVQKVRICHKLQLFTRCLTIIIVSLSGTVRQPTNIDRTQSKTATFGKIRASSHEKICILRYTGQSLTDLKKVFPLHDSCLGVVYMFDILVGFTKSIRSYVTHAWGAMYMFGFFGSGQQEWVRS